MQLKDKVIIITGGCQGLGRAMGEYLAAKGARLALVDLNQEKLDEAVAACKASNLSCSETNPMGMMSGWVGRAKSGLPISTSFRSGAFCSWRYC